jgi:hypothetical protein
VGNLYILGIGAPAVLGIINIPPSKYQTFRTKYNFV